MQYIHTLHTVCQFERNHSITKLGISVKILYFLVSFARKRSIFLHVEASIAWLYDCPQFLSPPHKACFDRVHVHFKDTFLYVIPFPDKHMIKQLPSHVIAIPEQFAKHPEIYPTKIGSIKKSCWC